MRLTSPDIDPARRKALNRRRVFLLLAGVFLAMGLLALGWAGVVMLREDPPVSAGAIRDAAGAEAEWTFTPEAARLLATDLAVETGDAGLVEQLDLLRPALADQLHLMLWQKPGAPPDWLLVLPLTRRQRAFQVPFDRLAADLDGLGEGEPVSRRDRGLFSASNSPGRLAAFFEALPEEAPDFEPAEASGPQPFRYRGPVALLPEHLRFLFPNEDPQQTAQIVWQGAVTGTATASVPGGQGSVVGTGTTVTGIAPIPLARLAPQVTPPYDPTNGTVAE